MPSDTRRAGGLASAGRASPTQSDSSYECAIIPLRVEVGADSKEPRRPRPLPLSNSVRSVALGAPHGLGPPEENAPLCPQNPFKHTNSISPFYPLVCVGEGEGGGLLSGM